MTDAGAEQEPPAERRTADLVPPPPGDAAMMAWATQLGGALGEIKARVSGLESSHATLNTAVLKEKTEREKLEGELVHVRGEVSGVTATMAKTLATVTETSATVTRMDSIIAAWGERGQRIDAFFVTQETEREREVWHREEEAKRAKAAADKEAKRETEQRRLKARLDLYAVAGGLFILFVGIPATLITTGHQLVSLVDYLGAHLLAAVAFLVALVALGIGGWLWRLHRGRLRALPDHTPEAVLAAHGEDGTP